MPRQKPTPFQVNGRCLVYIRVSTFNQARSGLGLAAQRDNCYRKAKILSLAPVPEHFETISAAQPGCFVDDGESAYKKKFRDRKGGKALLAQLRPGDTIIISRLDRMFRSVHDFIVQTGALTDQGIRLVCCSPPIDLGTAQGRMFAQFLAIVAEWESSRKGERISAALKAKADRDLLAVNVPKKVYKSLPSEYRPTEREKATTTQKEGRIFIYIRCSHRDSAESGLGLIHQLDVARAHAEYLISQNPLLRVADVFTDKAVSARSTWLSWRPAGQAMNAEARDGDHIIFSSIDRGFRDITDMCSTVPKWLARGIETHFAADGVCMSDPTGKLLANVLALFAQYESELISDRNKEARAQKAGKGHYCGGGEPAFWKVYKVRGIKKLVLCRRRVAAYRLARLYIRNGMTVRQALVKVEAVVAKHEKRPVISLGGAYRNSRKWKALPRDYDFDQNGTAWPILDYSKYRSCHKHYAAALEAMQRRAAQVREILSNQNLDLVPLPKHRVSPARWEQDGTTSFNKKRAVDSVEKRENLHEDRTV